MLQCVHGRRTRSVRAASLLNRDGREKTFWVNVRRTHGATITFATRRGFAWRVSRREPTANRYVLAGGTNPGTLLVDTLESIFPLPHRSPAHRGCGKRNRSRDAKRYVFRTVTPAALVVASDTVIFPFFPEESQLTVPIQ